MIFERSIKELLELDYDLLKSYLLQVNEETCKKILANDEIKHKLIDTLKRHNFVWLAQEDNNYLIPYLLEGNGLKILANTTEIVDKLNGIITSGQDYVIVLFKNPEFVKLVLNYEDSLKYVFSGIISEGAYYFVRELINLKVDDKLLSNVICSVNKNAQILIIKNLNVPNTIFWDLIISMKPEASEILMQSNSVGKNLNDLSLGRLSSLFEQEISLPLDIIQDRSFLNNITTMVDTKSFRILMNNLCKANDSDLIEKLRKKHYEKTIESYDDQNNMLSFFSEAYVTLKQILGNSRISFFNIYNCLEKVFSNLLDSDYLYDLVSRIKDFEIVNSETILVFFKN